MMNTTLNDKIALKQLREAMDAALEEVAAKFNLTTLRTGNIRYEPDGRSAKITVEAVAQTPDGKTPEQAAFEKYAEMFGMQIEWLGKTFTTGGRKFTVTGFDAKRRSKPVTALDVNNGKTYLFSTDSIIRLIGKPAPNAMDMLMSLAAKKTP